MDWRVWFLFCKLTDVADVQVIEDINIFEMAATASASVCIISLAFTRTTIGNIESGWSDFETN
jgi:hypothetical protein